MKKYKIFVSGCDDSTEVVLKLTDEQVEFVKGLADEVTKASSYRCQPTMEIFEYSELGL